MPDCMEEAKKIRKRQIDLAIAGDPLKLAVQEVDDLITAITLHSIDCPAETPALLQKRYSYALQRDENGTALLKVYLLPQSAGSEALATLLKDNHWPFAISQDLSRSISSNESLRENVGDKFRLDLPGLAGMLSSELAGRQVEPVTVKFVPTNDEVHGLICRSSEESLAAFAILVVFKMLGAHCNAYLYKLFLPDQFSEVPQDAEANASAMKQDEKQGAKRIVGSAAGVGTKMGTVTFTPPQQKGGSAQQAKAANQEELTFTQRGNQVSKLKIFASQLESVPKAPQTPSLSTFFAQTPNELIHLLRNHMKAARGATGGR